MWSIILEETRVFWLRILESENLAINGNSNCCAIVLTELWFWRYCSFTGWNVSVFHIGSDMVNYEYGCLLLALRYVWSHPLEVRNQEKGGCRKDTKHWSSFSDRDRKETEPIMAKLNQAWTADVLNMFIRWVWLHVFVLPSAGICYHSEWDMIVIQ